MRYVFAPMAVLVALLAAAQLVTATDLKVANADQVSIDIAALTRAAGNLPVTVADAI
jgi:hypothetical protein